MAKNRIKAYWLLLLALLLTMNMVFSVGKSQARYVNTAQWDTVVQVSEEEVCSKLLHNTALAPVTVLLGDMSPETREIPIDLESGMDASGEFHWSIQPEGYVNVEMTLEDTPLEQNAEVQLLAGVPVVVQMKLTPTEDAFLNVREAVGVVVTANWGNTLEGRFLINLPAVEPIIIDPPIEETEPPTEPEETEATEPSEEATEPSEEATEPSEEATEPSEEATEPSEEATEPSEEATEPSEEATEPSEEEATEPSEETTEPTEEETTEPSEEATEPTEEETTEPSEEEATEPSEEETTEPTEEEATEPSEETTEPTEEEATEPTEEATEPSEEETTEPSEEETTEPTEEETTEPTEETTELTEETTELTEEATESTEEETTEPTEETTEPTEEETAELLMEGIELLSETETGNPVYAEETPGGNAGDEGTEFPDWMEDGTEEDLSPGPDSGPGTEDQPQSGNTNQEGNGGSDGNPDIGEPDPGPGFLPPAAPEPDVIEIQTGESFVHGIPLEVTVSVPQGTMLVQLGMATKNAVTDGSADAQGWVLTQFPRYLCFSIDQGESYYMLYDQDVLVLNPDGESSVSVLLDWTYTDWAETELVLRADCYGDTYLLARGTAELEAEEAEALTLSSRFLTREQPLTITVPESWRTETMEYTVELLTCGKAEDGETTQLIYAQLQDPAECGIETQYDAETGLLMLTMGEKIPLPGSYRICMKWMDEENCVRQIQETFFINYLTYQDTVQTGGAEQ